jgi:hypothetical protein
MELGAHRRRGDHDDEDVEDHHEDRDEQHGKDQAAGSGGAFHTGPTPASPNL